MSYPGQPNYAPPPPMYDGNPGYCPPPPTTVVFQATGNCPNCRQGNLSSQFTCCGICLGIFFFPIGLVCMFLLTEDHCSVCGYHSG